ncbi:unnamed protein product [Urochloa humidicola]
MEAGTSTSCSARALATCVIGSLGAPRCWRSTLRPPCRFRPCRRSTWAGRGSGAATAPHASAWTDDSKCCTKTTSTRCTRRAPSGTNTSSASSATVT